jgi:RNA polymerase sigma-70 factor (ECF subfamily)
MTDTARQEPTFEAERARLTGLAYRITGSRTVAEDLVQEAWIRWSATDRSTIERPAAWLTTVTSRLALDHLRSAQHRRESYVGPWLPEPTPIAVDPAEHAELAESLSMGFLAVLERLGPTERVVFLLGEVFALPYAEIATVVDRSPEACRQIASRARTRVREGRPRFEATDDEAWQVAAAFLGAAQAGDLASLIALLDPEAVLVSDGGAEHRAARRPVTATRIPRLVANLARRMPTDAQLAFQLLNGQPWVVLRQQEGPTQAMGFSVVEGRIVRIWIVRNPDKLDALEAIPIR